MEAEKLNVFNVTVQVKVEVIQASRVNTVTGKKHSVVGIAMEAEKSK